LWFALGEAPRGEALASWVDGELVLTIRYRNPLDETICVQHPSVLDKSEIGKFGDLSIEVIAPDGADQTRNVFGGRPPAPRYGSVFVDTSSGGSDGTMSYQLRQSLGARLELLNKPGWRLKIKLVGFTAREDAKRRLNVDSAVMGSFWDTPTDSAEELFKLRKPTVLVESTIIVPFQPSMPTK
jgi:hypothetical protein